VNKIKGLLLTKTTNEAHVSHSMCKLMRVHADFASNRILTAIVVY